MYDDEQVHVELVSGHLTLTQPREIAMYAQTFSKLAELAVIRPGGAFADQSRACRTRFVRPLTSGKPEHSH